MLINGPRPPHSATRAAPARSPRRQRKRDDYDTPAQALSRHLKRSTPPGHHFVAIQEREFTWSPFLQPNYNSVPVPDGNQGERSDGATNKRKLDPPSRHPTNRTNVTSAAPIMTITQRARTHITAGEDGERERGGRLSNKQLPAGLLLYDYIKLVPVDATGKSSASTIRRKLPDYPRRDRNRQINKLRSNNGKVSLSVLWCAAEALKQPWTMQTRLERNGSNASRDKKAEAPLAGTTRWQRVQKRENQQSSRRTTSEQKGGVAAREVGGARRDTGLTEWPLRDGDGDGFVCSTDQLQELCRAILHSPTRSQQSKNSQANCGRPTNPVEYQELPNPIQRTYDTNDQRLLSPLSPRPNPTSRDETPIHSGVVACCGCGGGGAPKCYVLSVCGRTQTNTKGCVPTRHGPISNGRPVFLGRRRRRRHSTSFVSKSAKSTCAAQIVFVTQPFIGVCV